MGASDPFDMLKANFDGISNSERIFIDKVLHKAFVEFGEDGTEAVAVTSISSNNRQLEYSIDVPVFKCNRPFIFLIHENQNNTILFIGKYLR